MAKIRQNCDGITEIVHAPGDILDYGFDRTDWLDVGETILTSTWVITPTLTLTSPQISGAITSVVVNGGTLYRNYSLTNTITTATRTDSRTMILVCQNKGL